MSDHPSSSKNSNMQWMYEGTKSIVNREDYLLGKKIDRNFELYSDVVVKDKEEEAREDFFKKKLLHNGNQKISALDVRTVRNEDPLVALKFQEEQRRRQMLENPLLKLKAQKILQKEFEKQLKKKEKKLKKKHKKSRTSSSDEETPKKQNKRRDERSRSKEYIERSTRSRDDERSLHNKRKEERDSSSNRHHHHHKDLSSHSSERKREHLEEERTHSHSKLTAAEMEERRKAMLQNASWRDEMRENNFKMTAEQLKKEETETKNVPTFMRPVIDSANESVEKRLQSNKMAIQRSHDHMEKSFIRR